MYRPRSATIRLRSPSRRAYHRRRRVERHSRDADGGEWRREEIVAEGQVRVPCLDVELTLDEIYERVDLPAVGEPDTVDYDAIAYEP